MVAQPGSGGSESATDYISPEFEPGRLLEYYRKQTSAIRPASATNPWAAFLCVFDLMALQEFGADLISELIADSSGGELPSRIVCRIISTAEPSRQGLLQAIEKIRGLRVSEADLEADDDPAEFASFSAEYSATMVAFADKLTERINGPGDALQQLEMLESGLARRAGGREKAEIRLLLGCLSAGVGAWVVATLIALLPGGAPFTLQRIGQAMGFGLLGPLVAYAAFGLGLMLWSIASKVRRKLARPVSGQR